MSTPTEKPTPAEYVVMVFFASGGLIVMGIIALVVAYRAPEEKAALAAKLTHIGLWSIGIGAAIGLLFWLFRRLVD